MPKKYRVVSQAAPMKGKTAPEVLQGLAQLGMKPEQGAVLLQKNLVIKKDLDNPQALLYLEKFTAAGLLVKIEAYEVAAPPPPQAEPSPADAVYPLLESTFATQVRPTALTREYRKSFAIAALASLVSPLIYGGLILLSAWSLYWYFSSGHGLLFADIEWRGKFMLFLAALTYVVPAVVGTVLILFLLYPLWPQGKPPKPFLLDRKKHQRFYRLIDTMTASMGVPAPQHIEIVPDMNAAAGPVHGMASLARGELKLVIGMSLVLGTNVQQFMGVLAHEFGHFSQRSAMMAYIWINTVNHWLHECGYGQDVWMQRLEAWKEKYDHEIIHISLLATEGMIRLVRLLFQRLYRLNVRLTHSLSQQMEFDADLYEARVVGSQQFRAGTLVLRKMGYAWSLAQQTGFQAFHEQDKLLKNLPAAAMSLASGFTPTLLQRIEDDLHIEETRYWDTHPADLERIANAENVREAGMLQCDQPAALLFTDVEKLCEAATLNWYLRLGIRGAREFIVDNELLLQPQVAIKPTPAADAQAADGNRTEARSALNQDGTIEWTGSGKRS